MSDFDQYANEQYPAALAKIAGALEDTPLRELELIALRIMHVLEQGHIDIANTPRSLLFNDFVVCQFACSWDQQRAGFAA